MTLRSALAAAALALSLAGCWKSATPLMGAADRDRVELHGTWSDQGNGGSGRTAYRLSPASDRQIRVEKEMASGWKDAYTLSLDWLDSETYLAQAVDTDGKPVYQLLLGDTDRDILRLVTLNCDVYLLNSHKDITQDDGDCVFASYPVLKEKAEQAAAKIAAGDTSASEAIVTYYRVED